MEVKKCNFCLEEKNLFEFYKKSGSRCKKCHLSLKQKWRKENPEKYKEETKKYYERTKDVQNKKKKVWIEKNREKYNKYWTNRKKEDILFKLLTGERSRLWNYLKKNNLKKKSKTFDIVGCTPQELKEHLEKQFVEGMSWENRGEWNIDHIIPLASAKTEEELLKLFHYNNLQPLWKIDNIKKRDKILVEQFK
jgi:hypothetical protein